jgi:amino acid adenylation domain-containing protein/non-ribosomal peptide synthase protein (TIGR01720 family)
MPTRTTLALTAAQTEVWVAHALSPSASLYNITLIIEVTGPLDIERVRRVVHSTVDDAETVHMRFDLDGEVQYLQREDWEVEFVDLSAEPDPTAAAHAWMEADRTTAPDPSGRLFAQAVLRLDDERHYWYQRYHHSVIDGYGVSLIFEEVRYRYDNDIESRPLTWSLAPLIDADKAYRESPAFAKDQAYWLGRVLDQPEPAMLVPDVPVTGESILERYELNFESANRLYEYGSRENLRRTRIAVAALVSYISAATGRYDIVLSFPTTARVGRLARSTPSMASTILPVRVPLSPSMTLADVGRAVEAALVGLVRHGRYRGEDLARAVSEADPERRVFGPGINVLMLATANTFGGSPAKMLTLHTGPVHDIDFTLTGGHDGESLVFDLRANAGVEAELADHRRRLAFVLEQIVERPDRSLSSLTTMPADERTLILETWNDTAAPTRSESIPELFAAQLPRTPDAIAVRTSGRTLTYRQLASHVAQLAHALIGAGLTPEGVVAISVPRSPEMVVGVLAAMVAGGAFVPLDPSWPQERRRRVLEESRARFVLGGDGMPLDLDDWAYSSYSDTLPSSTIEGSRLAYVIFTSGSTGTPKGAMIRHEAICARLRWQAEEILGFGPGDATLFKAPLSFDISVNEILLPLVTGGTVVVADDGGEKDPQYLLDTIAEHGVTFVYLVSSMLDVLLDLARGTDRLDGLTHVWCGGEVLTPALFRRFRSQMAATLYHGYGPAEATIGVSHVVYRDDADRIATSIGRPNPNTQLYVLDSRLRPVPAGVGGELYAGGFLLGRGYVGAPALTSNRFVANPFGSGGSRLYRTGDLARWMPDGTLDFLGRIDNQIKIRGMRLELEDVEAGVSSHPQVRHAAVDLRVTDTGVKYLAAYVIPDGPLDVSTLQAHAASVLPEYMVPTAYVVLDSFPVTANGKLDRKALPEPVLSGEGVAARTDLERTVCEMMASVLGVSEIGVTDDFFSLGGDSIVAIALVGAARRQGFDLGARDVFTLRTAEAIAATLETRSATTVDEADEPYGEVPHTPIMARTRGRGGFVTGFHQSVVLDTTDDLSTLNTALNAVLERHDALRARLTDSWHLEITDRVVTDVIADTAVDPVTLLDAHAGVMVAGSLSGGRLVLAIHHLVVDGVSWRILFGDLATALSGSALPPVGTSVRRWAELVAAVDVDSELDYWREIASHTEEPIGSGVLDATEADVESLTVTAPDTLTATADAFRTGPDTVLLAALERALGAWLGRTRITVDVEGHGRDEDLVGARVDLTRTVGWFTTIYPVVLQPGSDTSHALAALKDRLRAIPSGGFGYGIARHLRRDPVLSTWSGPQVLFNYLGRMDAAGAEFSGGNDPAMPADHALTIDVIATDEGLRTTISWARTVLTRADVDRFAELWTDALETPPSRVVLSPSDFPFVELTAADVGNLDSEDILPMTALQEGIHFHSTIADGDDPYIVQQAIELSGPVDPDTLRTAAQRLVARHPALRTAFRALGNGRVVQVIAPSATVPFTVVATGDPDELMRADRRVAFDLESAPLVRYTYIEDNRTLLQSIHHLVADGWSAPIMLRDMLSLYGSDALPSAPSPARYAQWAAGQDHAASLDVWRDTLTDLDETPLPGRPSRPGTHTSRVSLTDTDTAELIARSRTDGLTISTLVHGAWGIVLGRMIGRGDVTFGSTVSGRGVDVPGIESMVGLFINTLPARLRFRPDEAIATALARWQGEQSALLAHHHVGLPDLARITGVRTMFESAVVFENYPLGEGAVSDPSGTVSITGVRFDENPAYPITIIVIPGDTLTIELTVDTARVDAETADALAVGMQKILTAPADAVIGRIALSTADLAHSGKVVDRAERTLVDLLDDRRRDDSTAVLFQGTALSYADLHARADDLAADLRSRGVGPESVVAVQMPRSLDLVVALVAVVKAGGAYLPIDPGYPSERIDFMLADANPVCVIGEGLAITGSAAPVEPEQLHPDHPAYVIYTSGSTGRPKGVVATHRGIVNRLEWMHEATPLTSSDRVLQKTSSSFDVSVTEFFGTLTAGAALVVAEPDGHRDTTYLATLIRDEAVTWAHFVPSMLDVFLADPLAADCTSLRVVVCSGEALPAATARRFAEVLPHTRLDNLYGPTEAAVDVTAAQDVRGPVTIGAPISNVRVLVLDSCLTPVAPGVVGELYLAGPALARGYLDRPGVSSTRFVAALDAPGERMYRTGDLVVWDESLHYVGRADGQVKVRGMRIELGEIEAALREHDSVDRAAVVVRNDRGTDQLVAYVVGAFRETDLREFLTQRLPDFMIPTTIVEVDSFPTGPSGKLDRNALPAPQTAATVHTSADGPAQTIAAHFGEILGDPAIGPDDDFFARGGDSILAIRLVNLARAQGITLTPRQIFELRTPRALAAAVPTAPTAETIADDGVGALRPLPAVHRLSEWSGSTDRFNQAVLLTVPPAAFPETPESAVRAVVDNHPALRSVLTRHAPGVWTVDAAAVGAPVFRRADDLDIEAQSNWAAGQLRPEAGTTVVAVWFDRGDEPGRLLLVLHHLVVDGVSWSILTEDLATAWIALDSKQTLVLEPERTTLKAFGRLVDDDAHRPARIAELPLWQRVTAPGAQLVASDNAVAAIGSGAHRQVSVDADTTRALLTSVPTMIRGDITDVLLGAFRVAVSRWFAHTGRDRDADVLVDLERHGRTELDADLSRTVGWFTSFVPVRLRGRGDTLAAVVEVKERLRDAPDSGIGYGMLRYGNARTAAVLAAGEPSQVLFNYLGRMPAAGDTAWMPAPESDRVQAHPDADMAASYRLVVNVVCEDALRADFAWSTDDLTERDIDILTREWVAALQELAALDGPRIISPSDVPLVDLDQDALDDIAALAPTGVETVWPLTPLQEGLYFEASTNATDIYTAQFALDMGHVDIERLRKALHALQTRHPALRAGFTGTPPVQFVPVTADVPITVEDAIGAPDSVVDDLMLRDRTTPFDLASPPLWRVMVIRLAPDHDRLVVNRQFLLWDGWSNGLVIGELLALYADSTAASAPSDAFEKYLLWLRDRDSAAARRFWYEEFAGLDEPTLVAQRQVPPVGYPDRIDTVLDADTTAALTDAARGAGVTLNAVVSAALALTIGATVGRSDVVFGITDAGRPPEVPGLDTAPGMFLSTVPVRARLDPRETVAALARRLQSERLDAQAHDFLGLAAIQRESAHRPLFDVLYVLQNFVDEKSVSALESAHDISGGTSIDHTNYPLTVVVTPGTRTAIKFEYRSEALDPDRVQHMLAQFVQLLTSFPERADTPAAAALVTSPPPHTEARTIPDRTIAELLVDKANETPDATALVFGDTALTYRELSLRIDQVARLLIGRGAAPETVVALALPRSIDMVVALFAVLRTGAAYLPLELEHPDARLHTIIADASPIVLLTEAPERFAATGIDMVSVSAAGDGGLLTDDELRRFRPGHNRLLHPAYVIYTSGSTGVPKGVVTPYLGLTNMQLNHREAIFAPVVAAAGRTLRIAHTVSFAFDMSWEELLWLVEGHEVHICDEYLRRDAEALVRYATTHRIDVVNVTPTYASHLIEQGLLDAYPPALVLLGGEAVGDAVWTALRTTDGVLGYNLYGPTEYTINTLGGGTDESATPTVGRPIWNTTASVLDGWLRPVADGIPGELYVSGAGAARGYLGQPGQTAVRFVADPLGDGERMYRTGDLMRRNPSGHHDYLGRTDDQIKIRGHRIELGEIESVVGAVDGVRSAAVIVDANRIVAYVTPAQLDTAAVRRSTAAALPDYMVPTVVMAVDSFPMTVNGKLDVAALPAPEFEATLSRGPATEAERVICDVFAQVLEVETVGALDNFFDLGGHSLLATRAVGRVRAALDVPVTIRDLFEAPTPEALAQNLDRHTSTDRRPVLEPRTRPELVPLSSAQKRLWLIQQLDETSTAYIIPTALRVRGAFDLDAFEQAVADVVMRHESLRTVFGSVDGEPHQIVTARTPAVERDVTDIEHFVGRAFDLARDIPIRVAVHRIGDDEHVLVFVVHHIATDEWSDVPMLRDLVAAYGARLQGNAPEFAPLPVQYADYALWQRDLLGDANDASSVAGQQLAYWTTALAAIPDEVSLPADRLRPARPSNVGGVVEYELPAAVADGVRRIAADTGNSVFMVLHAATVALINRLGGAQDIPLGAPVAGRGEEGVEDLVGFFVGTVVLRTDVTDNPTFDALLARVRETDLAAFAHADVPFETVVDAVAPARSVARNPLFQIMVSHHNRTEQTMTLPGLDIEPLNTDQTTAIFDLVFGYAEYLDTGRIVLRLEYAADLFDRSTAQTIAERQARLLGAVVADTTTTVAEIDMFLPAEHDQVLHEFNRTDRDVVEESLIDRFEYWVTATPDAVAIVDDTVAVTYAELDAHATSLAVALAEQVGAESIVGIAVPRSPLMVAATLAVLKLGAAYLPLDLKHPSERISYMLSDSGAAVVVTTEAVADRVPSELPRIYAEAVPESRPTLPARPASLDLAAYVIYTSGSTGRPKGVVLSHEGIGSLVATAEDRMRLHHGSTVMQFASPGFDVAVFELSMALCTGSRLAIIPDDARVAGPELTEFAHRHGVTHAIIPPSLMAALPPGCALPEGCTVLVGTEAVPPAVIATWSEHLNLLAAYGLTEATVNNTLWQAEPGWTGPVPIGVPDPNEHAYVLDSRLQPVAPGVPGELYIGGRGLARGYLGQPGRTADRFVACPFRPGRMYRTGDRAQWRTDGNLDFLGRVDDQVKIRGFRVEPGEVVAALAQHPDVNQAAVVVNSARLIGYVTRTAGVEDLDGSDVRAFVSDVVPDYMVPSIVMVLDGLPLTPNGKLDRAALPEPQFSTGSTQPRTDTERLLAGIFAAVLAAPSVGIEDNFFDLGGHSMAAMQVVGKARALGLEVAVRDVFDAPSVAELALRVVTTSSSPTLARREHPDLRVLAPAQVTHLRRENGSADHALALYRSADLPRPDADVLAAAVADVAARHEPLRSVFVDGGVRLTGTTRLETVDVDGDIGRRAFEIAQEARDLTTHTGLRVVLLDNGHEQVLLLVMHYLAVDEWSVVPLVRDLLWANESRGRGEVPSWPALPVEYSDYAQWAADSVDTDSLPWWSDALRGMPARVELPWATGQQVTGQRVTGTDAILLDIDADRHRRIDEVAAATGTSLYMVLHTAFAMAVAEVTGCADLPIAVLTSGRGPDEVDDVVGCFGDLIPIRTDTSTRDVLQGVRSSTLAALDHAGPAYADIVDAAGLPELLRPQLSVVHHQQAELGSAGTTLGTILPIPVGAPLSDLTLTFHEPPGDGPVFAQVLFPLGGVDRRAVEAFAHRLIGLIDEVGREGNGG